MSLTATKAFQFLSEVSGLTIERHEFEDPGFAALRTAIRKCVRHLSESDDAEARDLSSQLAKMMFLWLSVPVCFDKSFVEPLENQGDPRDLSAKFGIPFTDCINAAASLASETNEFPNPLCLKVQSVIETLIDQGKTFKIYCWQSVRPYFETLLQTERTPSLSEDNFIHSVAGYRISECFEVLIKVGPLRSKGIPAIADACLSAPKFSKLIQFVWAGCEDEEGIGLDPAASSSDHLEALPHGWYQNLRSVHRHSSSRNWQSPSNESQQLRETINEFEELAFDPDRRAKCTACLVEVGDKEGWVTTPFADELSFDPRVSGEEAVDFRAASNYLEQGMFLIIPRTNEIDVGSLEPEANFAGLWKLQLNEELAKDPVSLCERLKREGVRIKHLGAAVRRWATPASTSGIHSPLSESNFEKLIRVIQAQPDDPNWWSLAWAEIQKHNGKARQDGRVEGQINKDLQVNALKEQMHELREQAQKNERFSLQLSLGQQLKGSFECFKIHGVLEGYAAPSGRLREFVSIIEADEWREF